MSNLLSGVLYSGIFLCFLLGIEGITRKKHLSEEITRRVAHIFSGIFGLVMAFLLQNWVFIALSIVFLFIISLSYFHKFFSSIHNVQRKTWGELFLPVGILLAYILAGGATMGYTAAILILTFADSVAGFVGSTLSKTHKTIRGSVVFFLVTLFILLGIFSNQNLLLLINLASVLTVVERTAPYGTDNILLPIVGVLLFRFFLQV